MGAPAAAASRLCYSGLFVPGYFEQLERFAGNLLGVGYDDGPDGPAGVVLHGAEIPYVHSTGAVELAFYFGVVVGEDVPYAGIGLGGGGIHGRNLRMGVREVRVTA